MSLDKAGVQSWMCVACSREFLESDLTAAGLKAGWVILNLSPAEGTTAHKHLDVKTRVNSRGAGWGGGVVISLLYCFHIAESVSPWITVWYHLSSRERDTINYCDNTAMQLQKTDKNQRGLESESD